MLTVIGKNFVYAIVAFSIVGLGVSLWAVADRTNFDQETKNVMAQVSRLRTAQEAEREELKNVLATLNSKASKIHRGPDEIAANKDVSITEALAEAAKLENDLRQLNDQMQVDIAARITLIGEVQLLRQKLQTEKETGSRLRSIITPEPAQVGERAFRDIVASLQVAKDEVERQTEARQPELYNAAIRLQNLQMRLDGLKRRATELGIN